MNENESWLLDDNIDSFAADPAATKALKSDAGFIASNKMNSINGYVYGNLPGLNMCHGDKVSWHMIGMGTWSDVHSRKYLTQKQTNKQEKYLSVMASPSHRQFCIHNDVIKMASAYFLQV